MICALLSFDTCTSTNVVTGVASCPHITLQLAAGLHTPTNQRLLRQPAICSLSVARPTGRIAMPSSSPQSSPPQPQQRSKGAKARVDSDANIHNFAPVARIMKTALPENAKIAKEAKECMQECVSEFISFITSEGMLHHVRYSQWSGQSANILNSIREVSARKAQDGER